jgi:hypothetical protein
LDSKRLRHVGDEVLDHRHVGQGGDHHLLARNLFKASSTIFVEITRRSWHDPRCARDTESKVVLTKEYRGDGEEKAAMIL